MYTHTYVYIYKHMYIHPYLDRWSIAHIKNCSQFVNLDEEYVGVYCGIFFNISTGLEFFKPKNWGKQREIGVTEQNNLNNSGLEVTSEIRGIFAHIIHQMRLMSSIREPRKPKAGCRMPVEPIIYPNQTSGEWILLP